MNGTMTPWFIDTADRGVLRAASDLAGGSPDHARKSSLPASPMLAEVAGQRRRTIRRLVYPCAEPGYNQRVIASGAGERSA
jgi:hypothetical protein